MTDKGGINAARRLVALDRSRRRLSAVGSSGDRRSGDDRAPDRGARGRRALVNRLVRGDRRNDVRSLRAVRVVRRGARERKTVAICWVVGARRTYVRAPGAAGGEPYREELDLSSSEGS